MENYTQVTITVRVLSPTTCGNRTLYRNNVMELRYNLHALEVVRLACDGDLTGSYVKSNKPVAVISGNTCTQVNKKIYISIRSRRNQFQDVDVKVIGLSIFYEVERPRILASS